MAKEKCVYETVEQAVQEALEDIFQLDLSNGSYLYELGKVKEAFNIGTVTVDDFEEVTEEYVEEAKQKLLKALKPFLNSSYNISKAIHILER